ncbi:MaoC family dehydratase [Alicycliphilus denitrificans]|uniref:MaoC domain protein dehydratase n=2 Tax=Alicycliphilus denitrificans TaxID=179636 RepID=F4GD72_ALIDK|nr:MaoC family dehydratase [Alicycliphilus denitrificans]GAO22175.1 MaoC domain-containing protein dehydratase [Alicycliphilus sp. B1]HRP21018.1 MaoC family dehydratase [Alicycliphilus sp.]ADV00014.1 MaoC domain protein dehydratase [Alicycliphilus denitrificans BC]AEB84831.1 MaoC domain protein dehydratase [Alicycliphilus denitrificans K601]QKD44197.1 MaoC family dehydratase [Alicycliphilus denitrificans]
MKDAQAAKPLYLEDLAVGDVFVSPPHALDAQQIVEFASQFDPQPFHLDEQAAKGSFFEGLAASGWHTVAITMRLLVQSFPLARGVIGAGAELSWSQPTRPGDVLRVTSTIKDIAPSRSKPDRAIVVLESVTSNQHGAPLQKLVSKVVAFKRTA